MFHANHNPGVVMWGIMERLIDFVRTICNRQLEYFHMKGFHSNGDFWNYFWFLNKRWITHNSLFSSRPCWVLGPGGLPAPTCWAHQIISDQSDRNPLDQKSVWRTFQIEIIIHIALELTLCNLLGEGTTLSFHKLFKIISRKASDIIIVVDRNSVTVNYCLLQFP